MWPRERQRCSPSRKVPFASDEYEVSQVFYTSKDGTRVPMFISGKKGLKRNGQTPTLMFAYGGFNVSMVPHWDPEYAWWMEQGGYYAQPNLRGGGEYGEAWHKAGMFEKKQNVFDDLFCGGQYLVKNKYTSPAHLAIRGRSNGGLLMGVAMTQQSGDVWRDLVWLSSAGHVALPELPRRTLVDDGVWLGRKG